MANLIDEVVGGFIALRLLRYQRVRRVIEEQVAMSQQTGLQSRGPASSGFLVEANDHRLGIYSSPREQSILETTT